MESPDQDWMSFWTIWSRTGLSNVAGKKNSHHSMCRNSQVEFSGLRCAGAWAGWSEWCLLALKLISPPPSLCLMWPKYRRLCLLISDSRICIFPITYLTEAFFFCPGNMLESSPAPPFKSFRYKNSRRGIVKMRLHQLRFNWHLEGMSCCTGWKFLFEWILGFLFNSSLAFSLGYSKRLCLQQGSDHWWAENKTMGKSNS